MFISVFFLFWSTDLTDSVLWTLREEFLQKIEKRVKDYKVDVINEPRKGKKLLVLDIDYTLFGEF